MPRADRYSRWVSVAAAILLGVASAVVYGVSTVVQHRVVHREDGAADAHGLLMAARDRRWLSAVAGDGVGFILQVGALTVGSVVLVQPLTVLMLPVALVFAYVVGGPRPSRRDIGGAVVLIAGLAVFLALVGTPGKGRTPDGRRVAEFAVGALAAGILVCLSALRRRAAVRGVVCGTVAGAWFGMLAVLVNATSDAFARHGVHGALTSPRGYVPLIGALLLGAAGTVLTQVSFQIGALAATLPANLAADPVTAVVVGAVLLGEQVPAQPWRLAVYALCLAAVVAGAVQLASATRPAGEASTADAAGNVGGRARDDHAVSG